MGNWFGITIIYFDRFYKKNTSTLTAYNQSNCFDRLKRTYPKFVRTKTMSTAIMQTGTMRGWDYKFHDWNDSNDVSDIQLKVSTVLSILLSELYPCGKSSKQASKQTNKSQTESYSFRWSCMTLFIISLMCNRDCSILEILSRFDKNPVSYAMILHILFIVFLLN